MRAAFSLIELSIVLVILGLLTGGILTGQNLIRAAELRSVITEFKTYQTAVMTFRDKYFALPGDMRNATDFWGAMTNCGAASPSGTDTETCNGDGDGVLDNPSAALRTGETVNFWQHLSISQLIEGSYSGVIGSGSVINVVIGENAPSSKLGNTGWTILNGIYSSHPRFSDGDYGNYFTIGTDTAEFTHGSAFSPEEAWNIDKKIDDGLPQQGKVWAVRWDSCTDADNSADFTGAYLLSDTSTLCALAFRNAF
jgi:prepilin-type N-terminal cleavage/methylation domain-containing protein